MIWRLLPHLTACIACEKVILLDVRRDRYFALPAGVTAPAIDWLRGGDAGPPPALLSLLKASGLCDAMEAEITNRDCLAIPRIAGLPDDRGQEPGGPGAALGVAGAVGAAWLRLRMLPLDRNLARLRRDAGASADIAALRSRALRFEAARRWCPIARNCLLDSLALDAWLGPATAPRIVFGVIAHPFEAHCWVQAGDAVINDSFDRVSRFTPILVA